MATSPQDGGHGRSRVAVAGLSKTPSLQLTREPRHHIEPPRLSSRGDRPGQRRLDRLPRKGATVL
ncbi:MAG: hypothetical protein RIF41_01665 [Polyangiaceae bacterium]